jgi:PKD repeat protein
VKTREILVGALVVLIAGVGNTASVAPEVRVVSPAPGASAADEPTEFLVKYRAKTDADAAAASVGHSMLSGHRGRVAALFQRHGIAAKGRPFSTRFRGLDQVIHYRFQDGRRDTARLNSVLAELRGDPSIEYAEPNVSFHAQMMPNDPYYGSSGAWGQTGPDLWGLQKINAGAAWDISQGQGVTVAVVDTGVYAAHPDLAANMASNPGETGLDAQGRDKRTNGIDDDGDGYVDDWQGWDFVNWNNNPADAFGHGTHVAGTIAAVGNNGIGIIGVAPSAQILSVRVLDASGSGYLDTIAQGIIYAADRGARVINLSLGTSGPIDTPSTLRDAVAYAHDTRGAVVVVAAGNNGVDIGTEAFGYFPAALRDVVTVGATDPSDTVASFSNTGAALDMVAPGGGGPDPAGIYQGSRSILSLLSNPVSSSMTDSGQLIVGGAYVRQEGTSMATPHVAGVAALVLAAHPTFTVEQVRQALRRGSDDLGPAGVDLTTGYGRVNAAGALSIASPLAARLVGPIQPVKSIDSVSVTGTVGCASPDSCALSNWALTYGSGAVPTSWQPLATGTNALVKQPLMSNWSLSSVPDGTYTLRLVATAADGTSYEDRLPLVVDSTIITSPSPATTTVQGSGTVNIVGTVTPADFDHYTLTVTGARSGLLSNPNVTLTSGGLTRVVDGPLGSWNTAGVAADHYSVCIHVVSTSGTTVDDCVNMLVDPSLHPGWPQDVSAASYRLPSDHMIAADLDGDGTKELIVGYGYNVRVFRHDGSTLPGWPQNVSGEITMSPAVGDVTGDGLPKVVASDGSGNVYVWQANGTLVPGWPKKLFNDRAGIALADMNGDGVLDIVAAESGFSTGTTGSVLVVKGDGTLLPGWPRTLGAFQYAPPAVGDVDGDGVPEIVLSTKWTPATVWVLKADGSVLPGWPLTPEPTEPPYQWVDAYPALGDLDRDGALEILFGLRSGKIHAWHADATELPGWPVTAQLAGGPVQPNTLAVGDIDGDGIPEVVVGGETPFYSDALTAWRADGTVLTGFPRTRTQVGGAGMRSFFGFGAPVLADLDGDGKADILASTNAAYYTPFALAAVKSTGADVAGYPKPTLDIGPGPTDTVVAADLDGDGLLELAWIDLSLNLFVWDTNAPATAVAPWPMSRHDARRTGALPATGMSARLSLQAVNGGRGTVTFSPGSASCNNLSTSANVTCAPVLFGFGTVATLTATPASDSTFVGWGGACSGTGVCQITLSAIQKITATFRALNAPPIANAGGPYTTPKNQSLTLDGSASYDPEGSPLTYSWTFGDSTFGVGVRPTHTYLVGGTFTVNLTVSDGVKTGMATTTVTVTDTTPPAAVTTLYVSGVTNHSASLNWTATGDDGNTGTAARYDLRYSRQPIDASNFASATRWSWIMAPRVAGSGDGASVEPLLPQSTYYFALKVVDAFGNTSAISNVVSTPISGLTVFSDDFETDLSRWTISDPTGWRLDTGVANSPTHSLLRLAPPNGHPANDITTGPLNLVGGVKPYLTFHASSCSSGTIEVRISVDGGVTYQPWLSMSPSTTSSTLIPWDFDLTQFREKTVRMRLIAPWCPTPGVGPYFDDFLVSVDRFIPIAKPGTSYSGFKRQPIQFDGSASLEHDGQSLTYTWNFGDGTVGSGPKPTHAYTNAGSYTATLWVTSSVTGYISDPATTIVSVTNRPPIAVAGGPYSGTEGQAVVFNGAGSSDPDADPLTYTWNFGDGTASGSGVSPSHVYARSGSFTATLTVSDGTVSSTASSASVTVAPVPPAAISDLSAPAASLSARTLQLAWTAVGDDGLVGTATSYDVRMSTAPINDSNFSSAQSLSGRPVPKVAGSAESMTVFGLQPDTTYYFAIKVTDDSGNVSPLSHVLTVHTPVETVVFSDDMETGAGQWTISGSTPLMWHPTTYIYASATHSLYYGVEATHTYNTGARNFGSAITPALKLIHAAKPRVTFAYGLTKDNSPDLARLFASSDGGTTWTLLRTFASASPTTTTVDLSAYAGLSIQLKFDFDSVDATGNSTLGWWIDDVAVAGDYVNRVPTANAGGPYSGGTLGVPVALSGAASSDPDGDTLTYAWDFGDGTTGTGATPSHAYATTGTFTVSLVVNDGHDNSGPATSTVTVDNHPPVASTGGPYTGARNQIIAFSAAASSDPDGDALTYAWTFGDNSTGSGATPTHAYTSLGTFPVTVTVTDGRGGSATATTAATINNQPPVANAGGPYTGVRNQAIVFSSAGSSDPDGDPLTYAWDFGDGTTGSGASPTHPYATLGTFKATLTLTDGQGGSTTSTATVTINNQPPVANAGGPYTGVRNQAIAFSSAGSSDPDGDPLTYAWSFGDTNSGTGASPTHAYTSIGTFTVTLTVSDGQGGSTTSTATVTIKNQPPVANAGGPYTGVRNQAIVFSSAGSSDPDGDPLTYAWDFGDSATGTGANPTHAYASIGTFTVTLTVSDGQGGSTTSTATVTIKNQPPVANAGGPYTGVRNQAIAFSSAGSSDPDGDPLTYAWDFGDGTTGSGASPTHPYATLGTFKATLTVTDGQGGSTTSTATVTINNQPPVANAGGPYTGVRNQTIAFSGAGSSDPDGDPLTYAWSFGDSAAGTGANPTHAYTSIGTFTVTLTVTDGQGGSTTSTATVTINNQPPVANAGGPYTGVRNQAIAFSSAGSSDPDGDPLTYAWSFGDSGTGTGANPTHAYTAIGTFAVTLTVSDGQGGSTASTATVTINNQPPVANAGGPYTGVRNQAIAFSSAGSSDPDGDPLTYNWSFGDGATGTGASPTHGYAAVGVFTATLTVTDGQGGSTTRTASVTINNQPPVANANGPYTGVRNQAITFSSAGSSDLDGDPLTYTWTFDDGSTATGPSPTRAYTAVGTFAVTLKVTDGQGGSATSTASVTINNRAPVANAGADRTIELGTAGTLSGAASSDPDGDALTYEWRDSSNAVVGTAVTLTQAPSAVGAYDYTLRVRDALGAVSAPAVARLTVVDTTPPAVVVSSPGTLVVGIPAAVQWTASDLGGLATFDVAVSTDGGTSFSSLSGCTGLGASVRSCSWSSPGPATTQALVQVSARDLSGNVRVANSATFSIVAPQITVTAPNTNVNWGLGSTQAVTWTSNIGSSQSVRIDISRNGGSTWSTLAASVPNSGSWNWTVAGSTTTSARIRVVWTANTSVSDSGDSNFTIASAFITVTAPNTNVSWAVGSTQSIRWNHNLGATGTVKIELSRNGGTSWSVLSSSYVNGDGATGTFAWLVTSPTTSAARVRVTWVVNSAVKDTSNANFRIQ